MANSVLAHHSSGSVRYPEIAELKPGEVVIICGMSRNRGQALACDWRNRHADRDYRSRTLADGVLFARLK